MINRKDQAVQKESISFSATFKGVHENLYIPFSAIEAMYAKENGEGIIFEKEDYYESNDFKHHETNVSDASGGVARPPCQ